MAERATINRHYHIRVLVIGLACTFMSLWFFRDGYVNYPQQQATHHRYVALQEDYPDTWQQRWTEIVAAEGVPEVPQAKTDADILTQKIIGFLLLPVGLYVLLRFVINLRRWIEMDDEGLRTQSGLRIKWSDITNLDKTRWDRKGIAIVHYNTNGKTGRLTLDDWKFNRELITRMVERIDTHFGNTPTTTNSEPAQA